MDYKYPTPQLLFKAICNAIRSKTGNSDEIPHQNIPDELDKITAMSEEKYNTEIQRFIDMIEGTSVINDRIETMSSAFANCESLTTVNLPECTSIGISAFVYCSNLTTVNLPKCTYIDSWAFWYCTNLTTIILSNNQVVTLEYISAFENSSIAHGTGYIYVPDNLVDSYKTATNWSNYANQFKPISELPSELKEKYGYD